MCCPGNTGSPFSRLRGELVSEVRPNQEVPVLALEYVKRTSLCCARSETPRCQIQACGNKTRGPRRGSCGLWGNDNVEPWQHAWQERSASLSEPGARTREGPSRYLLHLRHLRGHEELSTPRRTILIPDFKNFKSNANNPIVKNMNIFK